MASLPTTITFTHTPTEIQVNPADYDSILDAWTQTHPNGELFPIPITPNPNVPRGTLQGVGTGTFTDDSGKAIERVTRVTYKTRLDQTN